VRRISAQVGPTQSAEVPPNLVGELSEHIRAFLAKKKAVPPGLQTTLNPDGSMVVYANNPEVGVLVSVTITPVQPVAPAPPVYTPQPTPPEKPLLPGAPATVGIGPAANRRKANSDAEVDRLQKVIQRAQEAGDLNRKKSYEKQLHDYQRSKSPRKVSPPKKTPEVWALDYAQIADRLIDAYQPRKRGEPWNLPPVGEIEDRIDAIVATISEDIHGEGLVVEDVSSKTAREWAQRFYNDYAQR